MNCKAVLITGGAQGIGAACADTFLRRGYSVSVCDIQTPSGGSSTKDLLFMHGDVTDPEFREHVVNRTLKEYGRIDVLINCAGIGLYSTVWRTPLDLAARLFDVNFMARFGMAQRVVPVMRTQGSGAIVNMGSIGGKVTLPWSTLYCASKHATHALSEGLHRELKPDGIHVMTVIAGIVDTNFRSNVLAGTAPPRIRSMGGVAPAKVAEAIIRGLAAQRRTVWIPWTAHPFDLLNRFFPSLIDAYCSMKQRGWSELHAERCRSKCIGTSEE